MTLLQQLEGEIRSLQDRLTLRPTLDLATRIGERLLHAKKFVGHGEWLPWLARLGMRPRTAQVYMQVANAQHSAHLPAKLSLESFLARIRKAKRAGRRAEMDRARQVGIDADLPADEHYKVIHGDCRAYVWPVQIDVIATDPPWHDLDAYRWLGEFARGHLREGGLLLAQCGQFRLPDVLDVLRRAGLTWQWMLDIVYPIGSSQVKPV